MTFKQIVLGYLRSWLETTGHIAELGTVPLAQSLPLLSCVVLGPNLITVIAAIYL